MRPEPSPLASLRRSRLARLPIRRGGFLHDNGGGTLRVLRPCASHVGQWEVCFPADRTGGPPRDSTSKRPQQDGARRVILARTVLQGALVLSRDVIPHLPRRFKQPSRSRCATEKFWRFTRYKFGMENSSVAAKSRRGANHGRYPVLISGKARGWRKGTRLEDPCRIVASGSREDASSRDWGTGRMVMW